MSQDFSISLLGSFSLLLKSILFYNSTQKFLSSSWFFVILVGICSERSSQALTDLTILTLFLSLGLNSSIICLYLQIQTNLRKNTKFFSKFQNVGPFYVGPFNTASLKLTLLKSRCKKGWLRYLISRKWH